VTDAVPRLAVFYDLYSASLFEVIEGARDLCRIVWVVGWSQDEPPLRPLRRFGEIVDVAGMTLDEQIAHIVEAQPDGVVVFIDAPQILAAAVAERLGLPFHSPHTARLLSDKLAQRTALQEAGLPVPVFAPVCPADFAANVPLPAVLKPRSGTGTRDTFRIDTPDQLAEAMAQCDPNEAFILEEWLPDRSLQDGLAADMVSVESVIRHGAVAHITITGRFPMAPPFRATGSFIPSNLGQADWDAVLDVTTSAIEALGINHGLVDTDVKLTPDGPRIIEVNGRLGGNINPMMSRRGGPPLFTCAMRLALAQEIDPITIIRDSPVSYYNLILAPAWATEVMEVTGIETLEGTPGIDEARVNRQPGESLNPQSSTQVDHVVRFDGLVESHAALNTLVHELIPSALTLKFKGSSPADSERRPLSA